MSSSHPATRAVPLSCSGPCDSSGMTAKLTQHDIAKLISDSVAASLRQALELGCTVDQVPAIAKAIGGNAGMVVWIEALERGVADE